MVGHVLQQGGSHLIRFPAIAEENERHVIHTPYGERIFTRQEGEALHPERESLEVLGHLREIQGEYNFAGQYQQSPTPLAAEWSRPVGSKPTRLRNVRKNLNSFSKVGIQPTEFRTQRLQRLHNVGCAQETALSIARLPQAPGLSGFETGGETAGRSVQSEEHFNRGQSIRNTTHSRSTGRWGARHDPV